MNVKVLVEMRMPAGGDFSMALESTSAPEIPSFKIDPTYTPVPSSPSAINEGAFGLTAEKIVVVRGEIEEGEIASLESQPNVVKVWKDTRIAPFTGNKAGQVSLANAFGVCPIPPCDCDPGTPKGIMQDVAQYLGVDHIWNESYTGENIVIGIVDGGITAKGRSHSTSGKSIPNVIGGWPEHDWGTRALWDEHGNMSATDALGMAPDASIYDIRISGDAISNALAGFQWAIEQFRRDGTPHILSNSWGIFQEEWDNEYAKNPEHPFTKKVLEALDLGILVLFAAGNCGETCPSGKCANDTGPGRSIWGANGHSRVITVGAVNKNEEFIGYSSQGPAALDPEKPDFCSISHFKGYFNSDTGTSAATPIAAGVVALLKQAYPSLTQDQVKKALKETAKEIGSSGWNPNSGSGIIQAKKAFRYCKDKREWLEPVLKVMMT